MMLFDWFGLSSHTWNGSQVSRSTDVNAVIDDSASADASIEIAVSYLKDPPASYQFPAFDIPAAFEEIISNVNSGLYANEYEFQADLYAAFNLAKDGHFRFIPDLIGAAIQFRRQDIALASVSLDGVAVPQIYTVCKYIFLNIWAPHCEYLWTKL